MTEVSTNFLPALPEIVLAIGTMLLLLLGAYRKSNALGIVSLGSVVLLVALFIIILGWGEGTVRTFGGMFVMDGFGVFMKELILLGAAASIVVSIGYLRRERLDRFEFPILTLLSVLGMMIMVSANDLISLYVGLEMQSLALYVLAAFGRDTLRSTEAGLKYFVLGALSSGFLLYGASLVYGFTGATNFQSIAMSISASPDVSVGVIFGIVFILAGLAFKVSAVPFHMWTPDVYEGSPTPVTTFFATAPKVAAMGLLVRVMTTAFPGLLDQWQQIIVFISIASMALGAFAAIGQTNIKRMMAYSAIGHIGYAMLGLAAGTQQGVQSIIIYLSIYIVMTFGAFVVILAMRRPGGMVEDISDLAGLSKTNPILAFAMAIMMFSLAGIPPLGGFFAKFYVFMAAIDANLVALSIIGVVTSVVGAFYYLRVVKVMYFDEPAPEFLPSVDKGMGALLAASSVAILLFFLGSGVLVSGAGTAAAALFH
jgi:NADH-quinone oxidoreductase subunit N